MKSLKRLLAVTAITLCTQAAGMEAAHADEASANASVNGSRKDEIEGELPGGADAKGVSIAGAKVFNPAKEDYKVNGAAANDKEKAALQELIPLVKATANANIDARQLATREFVKQAKAKTMPVAGDNPAFTEVAKNPSLSAATDILLNGQAIELALASASQTFEKVPRPRYVTSESPFSSVRVGKAAMPMAAALTINRDPFATLWEPSGHREISVDLSESSFSVDTEGDAIAVALANSDGAFINGTTDIDSSESLASPLFDLLIAVVSIGGGTPFVDLGSFTFNAFSNEISDSLGNVGISAVADGLLGQLAPIDVDTIGFRSPYSFTVRVPGTSTSSVLFLREIAATAVVAIPEPPFFMLFGFGSILLFVCQQRLSRVSLAGPRLFNVEIRKLLSTTKT